jgi:hypothetical protein
MSQLGTVITVEVDPDTNDGLAQAAAIVTGVYDDGSLRIRVLGANAEQDIVRNHVGDDGNPYRYADTPAADDPAVDELAAEFEKLTPDQQRAVLAAAAQQAPSTDAAPAPTE